MNSAPLSPSLPAPPVGLRSLAGILLLFGALTCSPDYESGVTACAATEPKCPAGFFCSGIRCYALGTPGVNPSGEGGSSTVGTGGASGMGAAPATSGRGGGSNPPPPEPTGSGGRGGSSLPPTVGGSTPPPPSGGTTQPPATPPGMAARCGAKVAADTCDTCIFTMCCPQLQGCFDTRECPAFLACLRDCNNNDVCLEMCIQSNPNGARLGTDYLRCQGKCSSQCGGGSAPPAMPPPGQAPPAMPPGAPAMCGGASATSPCSQCGFAGCCSEIQTCLGNAACAAIVNCLPDCMSDQACRDQCLTTNSAAVPLFNRFAQCLSDKCTKACS